MPATASADVAFHTGLPDKVAYGCRLLRKAWRQRATVAVHGPVEVLKLLDQALWVTEPGDFIPHWRVQPGRPVAAHLLRTPIWLVEPGAEPPLDPAIDAVAVNLGPDPLPEPGRYRRVIEFVDRSEDDRLAGRRRWRAYEQLGLSPRHLAPLGGSA